MNPPYDQIGIVGRMTPPNSVSLLGTAFLCSEPGCFITAAHVIGRDHQNLHILIPAPGSKKGDYQEEYPTQIAPGGHWPAIVTAYDPLHDLCVLRTSSPNKPSFVLSSTDKVSAGDPLAIWGFPHATDQRHVLTYQTAIVGAKIFVEHMKLNTKSLVLNFQTKEGQSGSPIFRVDSRDIIAIVRGTFVPQNVGRVTLAGINPASLNQTSYAVSAEYVKGMI